MISDGVDEERRLILSSPDEMEPYLSSKVLFWRVQGSSLPLCPGNLLLAERKTGSQSPELMDAIASIEKVINQKRKAWETKVNAEFSNRLDQWNNLVKEYEEESRIDAVYRYNVRVRVILALLVETFQFEKINLELVLAELDGRTTRLVNRGEFIWERSLAPLFPEKEFWFLYVDI